MSKIDELIHQPTRLRLMAALMALKQGEQMEFSGLRDVLEITDGNLGAHIIKLEKAEYVTVEKMFVGRKPKTFLSVTDKGRDAFCENVIAMKEILASALGQA